MKKALKYGFLVLLAVFSAQFSAAQIGKDTIITEENDFDTRIEDAITDTESDDQTDWSHLTDFLEDLRQKPLDLNTATEDDLLMLPGMTEIVATNLLEHIRLTGKLTSIYELQAVQGFDYELFRQIVPYVTVRSSREKDINANQLHPQGPPPGEMFREMKHELLLRYINEFERQKGFTDPDTTSSGDLTSRYLGTPEKVYFRWRSRYGRNFSFGVVGEKDRGEQYLWDPENNYFGIDYLSAHLFIRDFGRIKRAVIGDYTLQFGQGLVLSSGIGFGKGGETVSAVKRTEYGIRPYASVNENQFMRGAAATVAWKHLYLTGFFSKVGRDGNIAEVDTLTDEIALVTSLQTSGFHRTSSEFLDRNALKELSSGGRLSFNHRRVAVGATAFYTQFASELTNNGRDYQYFNFSGRNNLLTSVDFDITLSNFNFFGEVARSSSGGTATVLGILGSLHPTLDVSLQARNFDKDFHSFRGYAFAERPIVIQNEQGLYFGLKAKPLKRWTFSAYFDQFWFPWHRFNVSFPSQGYEYMAQLEYSPSRSIKIYSRFRSDNKEINASILDPDQRLDYLVPISRNSWRVHYQQKVNRNITLRSRLELSWFKKGEEEQYQGFMLYQDLIWKLSYKFDFSARYALFDVPDWDARIYAYENDILGYFSIPAYSGRGSRTYLMLNYKPNKNLEFWARISQWRYRDRDVISSGLNEIQGNKRTEIKLQMRLKFG